MNSTITSLSVNISNDPITGLKRKLFHYDLLIQANLEMTHRRLIVLYERVENGTPEGDYGRPILDMIESDNSLSEEQKRIKREMFKSYIVSTNTQGVYVNQSGQPISKFQKQEILDEDGNQILDDQGNPTFEVIEVDPSQLGIPELQFWQNLPLAYIQPTPSLVSEAIYKLMEMSMKSQDNNNRI